MAICFKENGQRILKCLRLHRYYLRQVSASMVVFLADTRASRIENLCSFTPTTTRDRVLTSRYRLSSDTIRSSFNDYRHRSCPCSAEAPAEVIEGVMIKVNWINRRYPGWRSREGFHDKALIEQRVILLPILHQSPNLPGRRPRLVPPMLVSYPLRPRFWYGERCPLSRHGT
jgi:hypothetical protein